MLVQKLRLKHGWSQQQLADLSGLNVRTIQRIERGHSASTESLKSLASVFEIDFSELTSDSEGIETMSDTKVREEILAFQHVYKLKRFYMHLLVFGLVIIAMAVFNLVTNPHFLWFLFPAFGWGLGIFMHWVETFEHLPFLGVNWEKQQVEKRLGRPL